MDMTSAMSSTFRPSFGSRQSSQKAAGGPPDRPRGSSMRPRPWPSKERPGGSWTEGRRSTLWRFCTRPMRTVCLSMAKTQLFQRLARGPSWSSLRSFGSRTRRKPSRRRSERPLRSPSCGSTASISPPASLPSSSSSRLAPLSSSRSLELPWASRKGTAPSCRATARRCGGTEPHARLVPRLGAAAQACPRPPVGLGGLEAARAPRAARQAARRLDRMARRGRRRRLGP
mmetsp:Transcript_20149/g.47555  ORF Transcript_20149/g.47555 Transcript_20149/m.47555 type:complete len:229 (-) Transcript_20149:6-692(-)